MKRSLVAFAWMASALLHAAVAGALALQPASPVKITLPKAVQLVKLAPPRPAPVVEPTPPPPPAKPPPSKPQPKPVAKPKPRPKPKPKPVAKPTPLPPPEPVAEPEPEPPAEEAVAMATPPAPPVEAPPAPPPEPAYQPVDVGVAYRSNPKPPYPSVARRRGWEGTVVLRLNLDKDGQPTHIEIADSSGHHILDKAALATVRRWRFQPATRDGEAVAASHVRVPIQFSLNDG